MNAPDTLPRRRLSSTYVHAPPSTQPPPPHSHSYAFNHHDFGPAAATAAAAGPAPHSYKHSPNNRTFTASSMTAPARTSMSSRRPHWRRPSAPPPPSPRAHIDVEMAPNVAVPILVARAANNPPPSTSHASHSHHHHHGAPPAPLAHHDSQIDQDDDHDNDHDNENESTTTTTTTSVTTSTTSRGKQPNGHHHQHPHHHHAHPSSAVHEDMALKPIMRRKSLPRTSAASHQSHPNNNNDSFHSSHDNHKLYARLQEWPSLNQSRVRGAYNNAHGRPSNRSKPRASHQQHLDVEPDVADPASAAHSTAAGGRGSGSTASSSGVPGRSDMKPAVPSCRPPQLHAGGYSNGGGVSNNNNTATRGKTRESELGRHQSPSGRLMMMRDPARLRTHNRKPPPSTILPGAAAAAAAATTHTSATSSSTAAASAPPFASHSTDRRRRRDWLRLRAALSSMRRAMRRTEGGDAGGSAHTGGTQGYASSPHVGMGVRNQDSTHRHHEHAREEDEKIDDEYRDVVDLDIDDEDEDDAGQEDDPLGEYCQRIDRLAANDRFMHYLTAPMSTSEYSDADNGYERRNGGLPRAKTRARIAATLRLSGKVGAGLDGNSSTANTSHGPGYGKQDGNGRHNGERSGRHDHDRTHGGGLHSWRGSTRSFSPQEHSHADEAPQSQHETQQKDRDGEHHAQTDAATDVHTTGTSAASTSTTTTSSAAAAATGNGGASRKLRKSKSRSAGGKGGAKAGTPLATTPQPASQLAVNKLYPLAFIRLLEAHAKHAADKRESSPPVYDAGAAHSRHDDLHAPNSSNNERDHECADVVFDDGDLRDLDGDLAPRTASWGPFRWRSDAAHHNQYYHNTQYTPAHNGGNTPGHVMHGSMHMNMNMNIPVPMPPLPRRGHVHGSGHGRHSHSNAKVHGSGPAFGFGAKARGGGVRSGRASAEITRLIGARRYRSMALHPQYSGDYMQPHGYGHHPAISHAHAQQYYAQQHQQPQLEQQQHQHQHDSFQQFQPHKHKNSHRAPRLRDRAFRQHQVPAPSASTMSAMFRSSSAGPPHGHGHGQHGHGHEHGSSLDHSRFVPVC